MSEQVAIKCRGIKKTYGTAENEVVALKGIDLDVNLGELTLLVGPSGSGKTTLLSIITNILTPDEGSLFILNHDMNRMKPSHKSRFTRENLGIVFQSLFLIPTLTVVENVYLPLLISGFKEKDAIERGMSALKLVHIDHRSNFSPACLSKGQQQRVAIARAMVHDSKILVCDEPTSALDQTAGLEVMGLLQDLGADPLKAVLVVTHDHRTFPFADRIISMSDGQIITGNVYE